MNSKVEEAALNAVRNLINLSNSMTSDEIKEGDKAVSFDGYIPIYIDNNIKKDNFYNKIDVQVKGRTMKDLSNDKYVYFPMSINDINNYKKIGGVLIFYVQVNKERTKNRIYVKALLPYEINKLLNLSKNKKSLSLKFEYIESDNYSKLEKICFQFQKDKNRQYSYKDENEYKKIDDFINQKGKFTLGIDDFSNVLSNPLELLNKNSFVYFSPDKMENIQIPCGMITFSAIATKKRTNIRIGNKEFDVFVDVKCFDGYEIYNINDCIFINSKTNELTLNFVCKYSDSLINSIILKDFLINKSIIINGNKISFNENIDLEIADEYIRLVNMLKEIINKFNIKKDFIVDFTDFKSVENLYIVYMNFIEKKEIPYKTDLDIFIFKVKIFNIVLSFVAERTDLGTYILKDLYNILRTTDDAFCLTNDKDEKIVIYPNYTVFHKQYNLDVSYLMTDNTNGILDNVIIDIERINDSFYLKSNISQFILDALDFYDKNESFALLQFLEKITSELIKLNGDEFYFNYLICYCHVLKRLNKLSNKEISELISIYDNTEDYLIKLVISVLLDNSVFYKFHISKLNEEQTLALEKYPVLGRINKEKA